MRNESSNLPDSSVRKGRAHKETHQNYSRYLQIGLCNWKRLKIFEKSQGDALKAYTNYSYGHHFQ